MPENQNPISVEQLIARYNQELLDFQNQQKAIPTSNLSQEEIDEQFPLPNIQRDLENLRQQQDASIPPPPPAEAENNSVSDETKGQTNTVDYPREQTPPVLFAAQDMEMTTGYLKAFVTTGRGALPVPNAQVIITRVVNGEELLEQADRTDSSGYTPLFALPAVSSLYSQSPENGEPYTYYTIYVRADGFYPIRFREVPIYGGSTSIQPVDLIPVAEGDDPNKERIIIEGAPSNLQ